MSAQIQYSEREGQVIEFLIQGKSNKQIALALGISVRAVEFHLSNIYAKLGVTSRTEAALKLTERRLRESTSVELRESTGTGITGTADNGEKLARRRILMKNLLIVLSVIGLGIALIPALASIFLVKNGPVNAVEEEHSVTPNLSPEMLPTTPASSTALPKKTLVLSETTVPVIVLQPTPPDILGGGIVSDGYFEFDLRLFRDASFSQHPVTTSLYSDLEGIGAWMYWYYTGADTIGPVQTYWGTLPQLDQLLQETYDSIQLGSSGGRNGGVMLPGGSFLSGESKPGDRVQVVLKVVTPDGEYGGVLVFTLEQGINGFQPADISVDILRSPVPTPSAQLTGPTVTYTDPVIGYAIDYPANWYIQAEPGGFATLTSFPLGQNGTGGLSPDQAKIDLAPAKPSQCESLSQLVEEARKGESVILWEQQWSLAGEIPAVRMHRKSDVFGESASLLTVINRHCVNVSGMGDTALFDAIVTSLRPFP